MGHRHACGRGAEALLDALDRAAQAVPAVITQGMDKAMNRFISLAKIPVEFSAKEFRLLRA